jgi:hypothetical protein
MVPSERRGEPVAWAAEIEEALRRRAGTSN